MRFISLGVVIWVGICVVLSGCASFMPKFQKATDGGLGYSIVKPISSQGFVLKTNLGSDRDDKDSMYYGHRAVGEECLARGYRFFDVAIFDANDFEGYCYKTADHPALGVEFADLGLQTHPQHFIVANLYGKTQTLLEKGDEILLIEGAPALSVATFKAVVFRASLAGHKTVDLKIKRHDEEKQIKEPIALFKNSSMGSTQLDLIRSHF